MCCVAASALLPAASRMSPAAPVLDDPATVPTPPASPVVALPAIIAASPPFAPAASIDAADRRTDPPSLSFDRVAPAASISKPPGPLPLLHASRPTLAPTPASLSPPMIAILPACLTHRSTPGHAAVSPEASFAVPGSHVGISSGALASASADRHAAAASRWSRLHLCSRPLHRTASHVNTPILDAAVPDVHQHVPACAARNACAGAGAGWDAACTRAGTAGVVSAHGDLTSGDSEPDCSHEDATGARMRGSGGGGDGNQASDRVARADPSVAGWAHLPQVGALQPPWVFPVTMEGAWRFNTREEDMWSPALPTTRNLGPAAVPFRQKPARHALLHLRGVQRAVGRGNSETWPGDQNPAPPLAFQTTFAGSIGPTRTMWPILTV